jgi:hypothetical protein
MGSHKENGHPVIEIVAHVDHAMDHAGHVNEAVKVISGERSFRVYSALKGQTGMNSSGNLRGMVRSARWRLVFNYSSEVGEHLENLGTLAAFAANVGEMWGEFEAVAKSSEPASLKGMRFAAAAGTAAERTLLGAFPSGVHLIYLSLQGWCQIAGLAGGKIESGANDCVNVLKSADVIVQKTFSTITDTGNQSKAFWSVVNLNLIPSQTSRSAAIGGKR